MRKAAAGDHFIGKILERPMIFLRGGNDYRPAQGPGHRSIAFQTLPHTVGAAAEVWVPLSKMHDKRNALEYMAETTFSSTEIKQWIGIAAEIDGRPFHAIHTTK